MKLLKYLVVSILIITISIGILIQEKSLEEARQASTIEYSQLAGKWINEVNLVFEFYTEGSGIFVMNGMEMPFFYAIEGDKLKIVVVGSEDKPDIYRFKVEKDVFSFGEINSFYENGYTDVYQRIE